ncbi:Hydrocephalus-inducing protein [Rhizoctonia solani]|uniref:Hydrocephalus-inducing protein n=1 Tax=Rhizoctonia solani TaxID=456999 RepID=A0A8H8NYY8_9AGAM|nr:Hydrocephalus-inducing protein [Rhizoctonia solani]QRW22534.1 Hydrocephalus-inducing protein [Rhizoctonia solani]
MRKGESYALVAYPRLADSDLWFELLRRDVSVRQTEKETSCTECSALYCHRQEDNDSEDDDPEESDFGNDDFAYHDACLIFDFFSQEGTRSIEDAKESFVCPDCWDHHKDGLYPPMCQDSVELRTSKWPRLVMVVYYLQEFWPQTQHLITMTSGLWKQLGWEFQGFSVRLQHLQDRSDVTAQLQWEAGSFQFMAVFITHGLTGDQGYQLDDSEAVPPLNLLQLTLPVAQTAVGGASLTLVFFFACGHPMMSPIMVSTLQDWVNKDEEQRTLVACLNKKLSPVYMFNWLNKATKALAEEPDEVQRTLRLSWLRDSIAPSHSDLLFMSNGHAAEMWLYAPFQSRPLGRPLPSLLSVCPCSSKGKNQRRKKIWKVDHNGKSGRQLCDVEVKAICRACRQKWPLPQEDMKGILVKVNGVYAAIVPYFL